MTPERAKQLLREIWGGSRCVTEAEAREISLDFVNPNETLLGTCQRIAGDTFDWKLVPDMGKEYFSKIG